MRRSAAWGLALPLAFVGSQAAHSIAYALVYPQAHTRALTLFATGHAYLVWLPFALAAYVAARLLLRTAEHVGRAFASPLPGGAYVELVLAPAPATLPVRVAAASRESRAPPRVATV